MRTPARTHARRLVLAAGGSHYSVHREEYHTCPLVVDDGAAEFRGRGRGPGCTDSGELPTPLRLIIFCGYRFQEYVSWDLNPDCMRHPRCQQRSARASRSIPCIITRGSCLHYRWHFMHVATADASRVTDSAALLCHRPRSTDAGTQGRASELSHLCSNKLQV